jgi:tetratricopeptide (TPR) repeat protein
LHALHHRKDKRLLGLLLCLSRLSAPAQEWAQKNGEARRHVHLFGVDKVAALLKRARLISSPEPLGQVLRARLREEAGPPVLTLFDGRFYWVQAVLQGRRHVGYVVLEADGQPASKWIAQEIKRLDPALEGKRFYDLQLRERVLLALLDLQKRNLEELAKETRDPLGDVRPALQDLVKEQMLEAEPVANPRWKFDRYAIRPEMEIFLSLARQFLEGPHRFKFLASAYAARALASDVPKYLERRLRLTSAEAGRLGLVGLISVSPAAFQHTLFAPADRYASTSGEGEARGGQAPPADRERARQVALGRLQSDLIFHLMGDMQNPHFLDLMGSRGIKAYLLRATAKGATLSGTAYHLRTETITPLGKPAAPGRAGGASGEAAHFVDYGQALMHMEEYEAAVAQFDRGLRDLRDPLKLTSAWTHRGICLLQLKKPSEAINSFNEALRYNANYKEAWYHKAIGLKELGDTTGAMRCCKRALELDPAYGEAREYLQTL